MDTARTLVGLALAALAAACTRLPQTSGTVPSDTLRRTALVEVFETHRDSVVKFTATRVEETTTRPPDGKGPAKRVRTTHTQWGSGCIIHEKGYVLSNSHMLRFEGKRVATLSDGKSCPTTVIAEDPANDLALLKIDAGRPLKPLRLGESGKVMVGEPVVTIGNPFGISFSLSAGIVSGIRRSTTTEYTSLRDMIQTDAAINPGTSGGPLLNVLGEMIGLCTSNKREGQEIGFAISSDGIRAAFADLVAAEGRYGFVLGMKVAADAGPARVTEVAAGSPAEAGGVKVGDVVAAAGGEPVREGLDFHLALIGRKGGEALPLRLVRDKLTLDATVQLEAVEPLPAQAVEGLVPGLVCQHYKGSWKTLPDFGRLKPAGSTTPATFDLGPFAGKESFALQFTGYFDAPRDGVYQFSTRSDDGSRVYIGERLVVNNDGLHAAAERRGFVPLCAGKHPIRVTFFQGPGDLELKVYYEGPGITRREIPASALYRPGK